VLGAARLQQRIEGAVLCVERAECLFDGEGRPGADARAWTGHLLAAPAPVVFVLPPGLAIGDLFAGVDMLQHELPLPSETERADLWAAALGGPGAGAGSAVVGELADRFVLTPGQIRDAARAVARAGARDAVDLFAAARRQSSHELARLAQPVVLLHDWRDLVLPEPALARLRDIAGAVRHRTAVYGRWGFAARVGTALGIKALFAGPSGTGKTMAAGVLACDLGLDLYRIDLSAVVSKYIGETEKNLDRIFRAAAGSNAVLLFDEADALFGKRSEVKDAHDRYANIEVAYLLQKIEDCDGVVLLATNLAHNIDEAFSRRLQYVVEFPLPDERLRERLWRGMFPAAAPLVADIDFAFLARQFKLAGGDIRNVALDAAFLAASDGGAIGMRQLIVALARQVAKEGRVPSPNEFKQYYALCA
jgi:DNA polymerase III delta prime subunit